MSNIKLNIDFRDENQVKAMAAFFNTLSGLPVSGLTEIKPLDERVSPVIAQAANLIVAANQSGEQKSDADLSFGELKAKYPGIKAKSKLAFLAKLEELEDGAEQASASPITQAKEEATEEATEKIDLTEIRKFISSKLVNRDNGPKLKAKLLELGAENATQLEPSKYSIFVEFMNTLS
jgi:hypothetical protein